MFEYSITMKIVGDPFPDLEDYQYYLFVLGCYKKAMLYVDNIFYELDSKGKLHLHGICYSDKRLSLRWLSYHMGTGLHLHLDLIQDKTNHDNWVSYISKTCSNESQQETLLMDYFYKHNYGFVEGNVLD